MEFRILEPHDVAHMHSLLSLFGRAFGEHDADESSQPNSGYLYKLLDSPGFIAIVALRSDRVVGGLTAYVLPKYLEGHSEIYLYDLAVDEPFRRKGVATGLIEELCSLAIDRGAKVIYVQAHRSDAPAIALYSNYGAGEDVLHFEIRPRG